MTYVSIDTSIDVELETLVDEIGYNTYANALTNEELLYALEDRGYKLNQFIQEADDGNKEILNQALDTIVATGSWEYLRLKELENIFFGPET